MAAETQKTTVQPPRSLRDAHTLLAQKYAGALVGNPYRNKQWESEPVVDRTQAWKEPPVVSDDCIFCKRLTDEEAVRRVAGFQHQIDIECTRNKRVYFTAWMAANKGDVPEPGKYDSKSNLRKFCELFQDMPTEKTAVSGGVIKSRPNGWKTKPFPLVDLPLRLKRKLCIEWNHLYLAWMLEDELQYDFKGRFFYHERPLEVFFPVPEGCLVDDDDSCL